MKEKSSLNILYALLGWSVLLAVGIICDLEYYGYIHILQKSFLAQTTIGHFRALGFHYRNALTLLQGSFGILITAVNFILTLNISIADQSEKLIYGFSRQELSYWKQDEFYNVIKCMIYFAPVLLVIVIVLGWCISGYIILLFDYMFLIYNHMKYANGYGEEKKRKAVANYLLDSAKDKISGESNLPKYKMLLEHIRINIEKEQNWHDVEYLYMELKKQTLDLSNEIDIILIYYFFSYVYVNDGICRENIAIQLVKKQVTLVESDREVSERECMILCGMWYAIFNNLSEKGIIYFLEWLSMFAKRSYQLVIRKEHSTEEAVLEIEIGLFLVFVECWLAHSERKEVLEVKKLQILWAYGKEALSNKNEEDLVKKYLEQYEECFGENFIKLKDAYEILQKDIKYNGQLSCICSLLI